MNILVLISHISISGVRALEDMIALTDEMSHDILAGCNYDEATLQWLKDHFLSTQTYLQNTFPFNLQSHSDIRSHCLDWLTGDPEESDLQNNCQDPEKHMSSCKNCDLIPQLFMVMMGFCNLVEQARFRNDLLQIQNTATIVFTTWSTASTGKAGGRWFATELHIQTT